MIVAVVLGIFVLSKAFPTGGVSVPTDVATPEEDGGGGEEPGPLPSPTQTPTPGGTGARPDIGDVTVKVLNGAGITGLAEDYTNQLGEAGWDVQEPANATRPYERTTIVYKAEARQAADFLRQRQLPRAQLERAPKDADVDITVVLGSDAAPGG